MKFLVTGGGGFLGSHLTRNLVGRGDQVRVLGRHRYPELEALGVHCSQGDIRDPAAVREACAGCDGVFHVAGVAGFWGPRELFFTINVKGTANVIQGCIEEKVPRLVYTSSPSVVYDAKQLNIENGDESLPYPRHFIAPYPESKARAEKMVLQANGWEMVVEGTGPRDSHLRRLATCALRPHLIWGVGDTHLVPRILAQAKTGKLRIVGSGRNRVSMTHVQNAATAHVQAMDALAPGSPVAGNAYFVNDPEPVYMWEWVNEILRGARIPQVTKTIPYRVGWLIGGIREMVHAVFPGLGEPRITRFIAAQMAGSHWFSCRKAEADFGYAPGADRGVETDRLIASLGVDDERTSTQSGT